MKKAICLFLSFLFFAFGALGSFADGEIQSSAKSLYLIDAGSGEVLYAQNENEPLPPASVTKIMTLLLVFEALEEGKLTLDEKVPTSERAAGMGGSQIYLEPGEEMTVDDLLKAVVVASANDAAAALSEHLSGSLEAFVARMNERAAQLGMTNTHFENTNGLDDTTTRHVTSARDIAIMSRELLKHKKIFDYTNIWMDTVRDGEFTLTNTNRLIRFYRGANGLKTGSTAKAGFCISATAERDGMQLIAVVMGSPTRDERNKTAAALLDYGFANYENYRFDGQSFSLPVLGSKTENASLGAEGFTMLLKKGQGKNVQTTVELPKALTAPLDKGTQVGRIVFTLGDKELGTAPIILLEDLQRLSVFDIFLKMLSSYTAF